MSYVVCIPSYKRSGICNDKTLRMLHEMRISSRFIHVYVANYSEYEVYKRDLNPTFYAALHVGKKGLVQQRAFIESQWPKHQHIVFMDDDVSSIDFSLSPKFSRGHSLDSFITTAFQECKVHNSFIWGVYPVFNPFYRSPKKEQTAHLSYIVGAFYGVINRPGDKELRLTITQGDGQKEDVERSIKYFIKDGVVLRFNKIGFITKYFGSTGGLGTFQSRMEPMKVASTKMAQKYPEMGYIITRKTGMHEFRLRPLSRAPKN